MLGGMKTLTTRIVLILLLVSMAPMWGLTFLLAMAVTGLEQGDARALARTLWAEAVDFFRHWLVLFKAPAETEDEVNGV